MPHIIVEHSAPLLDREAQAALLEALHRRVAAEDSVDIRRIKTRAVSLETTLVGDEDDENLMLHIALKLLAGRPPALRKAIAADLQDIARAFLARRGHERCPVTVETIELDPQTYCG